jgi:phosphotransferase system enzyme I (PtsI)
MKILKGTGAAGGYAAGMCCLYSGKSEAAVPHYAIREEDVDNEIKRLSEAYDKAVSDLEELKDSGDIPEDSGTTYEIINAHKMILEDANLRKKVEALIAGKKNNAEHAVSDVYNHYAELMKGKSGRFSDLAHDMDDIKGRLLESFAGTNGHFECPVGDRQPVIVAAENLTPSMLMNIKRENVLGFVTRKGGLTTHATILARSYRVPVVYNVDVRDNIECGMDMIVDGALGKVIIQPDEKTRSYYQRKIETFEKRQKVCSIRREEPVRTGAGTRIELMVNITTAPEMSIVEGKPYDGVGLLRTEFLFSTRKAPPTEDEQYEMYMHILEEAGDRPVITRLLDIAGDKLPVYLELPEQDNPDLGIRGARALEFFYDIYLAQVKALMRCASEGDMRILYPMITDRSDIFSFGRLMKKAAAELKEQNKKYNKNVKKGIMIETPSAAIMSGSLLEEVDFANIGSNDLLQYTLAAERGNSYVENKYHVMHPALVSLMRIVATEGEKHGKDICLCGEVASFEEFYPLFLSMGLKKFSVAASKFDDIKCHLMYEKDRGGSIVKDFMRLGDKKEIDVFFKRLSAEAQGASTAAE